MKLQNKFYKKRLKEQNSKCYYCGKDILKNKYEIDHIQPHSKTRNGTRGNLCLSCVECNRVKRDYFINEFRELCLTKKPHILKNGLFYFEIHKIILSCHID